MPSLHAGNEFYNVEIIELTVPLQTGDEAYINTHS